MVRPLRIDLEGGWYHVMSRGTERRTIFIDKSYSFHFLELLGEMSGRSFVRRCIPFEVIVSAVEDVKGERWSEFCGRYGDWGCAMVLHLARQRSGLSLRELGARAGGMDYKAISVQIRRLRKQLGTEPSIRRAEKACLERLSNVEM